MIEYLLTIDSDKGAEIYVANEDTIKLLNSYCPSMNLKHVSSFACPPTSELLAEFDEATKQAWRCLTHKLANPKIQCSLLKSRAIVHWINRSQKAPEGANFKIKDYSENMPGNSSATESSSDCDAANGLSQNTYTPANQYQAAGTKTTDDVKIAHKTQACTKYIEATTTQTGEHASPVRAHAKQLTDK